jgi:DNA-binding response OmpR family regulator
MNKRVLLIEDSKDYQSMVNRALEGTADVTVAPDLSSARRLLDIQEYDLLLLDVGLPDGNGFGFCSAFTRQRGLNRPRILFLTGRHGITDKLNGFSAGGDDYLLKPFDPRELKARVQTHLRVRDELLDGAQRLHVGSLVFCLVSCSLEIHEESGIFRPSMTPTEFRILYRLASHEGRILSRDQLLPEDSEDDSEFNISERNIDVHMSRIRKKIAVSTHSIESIYGVGYRLVKVKH